MEGDDASFLSAEKTAQMSALQAEVRVLQRQRARDREEIRALKAAAEKRHAHDLASAQLAGRSINERSPARITADASREARRAKQAEDALHVALNDKAILVHALQVLTRELAAARCEARQHAEALRRAVESARRLGQMTLNVVNEAAVSPTGAPPGGAALQPELADHVADGRRRSCCSSPGVRHLTAQGGRPGPAAAQAGDWWSSPEGAAAVI